MRLGEGGDLTTNVHTKHTLQIYEKLSYEALNRHFCQTAVCASHERCPTLVKAIEKSQKCNLNYQQANKA
ncbi:MAG: hypothetical protein WAQ28_01050, partial [Bacteroidia bacterium]